MNSLKFCKSFLSKTQINQFVKFNRFYFAGKSANVVNIKSTEEFDNLIKNSTTPLIVDFYADWCGPCRMLGPVLEKKLETAQNAKLVKVNVDNHGELAERFEVSGIPHVILFKNGAKTSEFAGFNEKKLDEMFKLL